MGHAGDRSLDGLARQAAEGDRDALSELVREIQNPMYRLALRFLGDPDDAQDACQEILIRIVTRLGTFEGRSKFTTWAYTVGVRSLLRTSERLVESSVQGAERFAALLDAGMGDIDTTVEEAEYRLLCDEVRISCTYGMLLCLSRPQRAAYLLADVLGLSDTDGAEILDCSREAFRQRVSRTRRTLRHVIDNRCGLVDPANPAAAAVRSRAAKPPESSIAISCGWLVTPGRKRGYGSSRSRSSSTPSSRSAISTDSIDSLRRRSCGTTCRPGSRSY